MAVPWEKGGSVELETFELFCTRKDASETLEKLDIFDESCRPVPVEIKILA